MSALIFESAEELESLRGEFKLVPEEEYILEVREIEIQKDKTSQFNPTPHDEWLVRFTVISFGDGTPAYYEDGSEPEAGQTIRLTTFIDPTKKGMVPRPSKARKFLTAALGLPTESRIELDSVEDLIGKRLIGRVIHKKDGKGVVRDRLDDFRAISRRPPRRGAAAAAPKATEEVEADAESLLAKAIETFGEDAKF
jgi:hypothetical protein